MTTDLHQELSKEFGLFEAKFRTLIQGDFPVIEPICRQIFKSKGKQLRPLLVFLTHKLFREEVSEQAYLAASLVEIVHAASLVHDDVVDMADMRRGNASVRALFGNKTAVLAGDYLLAHAFLNAYDKGEHKMLRILVEAIRRMSEGELLQLQYARNPQANYQTYYRVVECKTAALFRCCCHCGALTAGASPEQLRLCEEIGNNLGIAFQIQDDLLDLDTCAPSGKLYGNDLREGKLTLPALYMLENASVQEKEAFFRDLEALGESEGQPDNLIDKIKRSGGEAFAREQALLFREKALNAYKALQRPSPLFEALTEMIFS
ncbi:MAG: polyprenyl synthetase family protein [Bacteroidales bacterium]|nr:polyprenyl synthetase family protein [Bacteroidales bacterium]